MSNDEHPADSQTIPNATSNASKRIHVLDIDWYLPSTSGESASVPPPSDSGHSLLTALNTQANARAEAICEEEEEAPVRSIPEIPESSDTGAANDILYVRTPSPIAVPTLSPDPLITSQGAPELNAAAGRIPEVRNTTSSRNNAERTRNSHSKRDSRSRRASDSRKDTELPPLPANPHGVPFPGSPLSPANNDDERRTRSSRRSSRTAPPNHGIGATPYPGLGIYTTPLMYPAPLPFPQYVQTAPGDYYRAYPSNTPIPSFTVPTSMPTPYLPPQYTPFSFTQATTPVPMQNLHRQSNSENIVTAVAMTPELKNLGSIVDPRPGQDTESFADNNPYNIRTHSRHERVSSDLRNPYPPTPPLQTARPIYGGSGYTINGYPIDLPPSNQPTGQSGLFPPPVWMQRPTVVMQDRPLPLPPAVTQIRDLSNRRRSNVGYSRYTGPDLPTESYYAHPRMTAADVVSATANMPTPENRKDSLMSNESIRRVPTPRRDASTPMSSFAANDPYRLPSRKPSVDALPTTRIMQPRREWDEIRRPLSPRPGLWRYSSDYLPSSSDLTIYPPHLRRRSSSLDRLRYSRSRRGWLRHSPSPVIPSMMSPPRPPFMMSASSAPEIVPLPGPPYEMESYYRHSKKRGFLSNVWTFFKSPFDRGRPISLYGPYPRESDEPITWFFIITVIIGQIYFHLLLRLPSLYFSRVSWIFDEANLSLHEITEMAFETSGAQDPKENVQPVASLQAPETTAPKVRPQYERLKNSWEAFIDSLIHEWETFNIVAVLLLSAILTILQISTAASDPVTRYAALFSLTCALVSLLFGCMYIIRFGTMRKTYAAVEWAKSALGSTQSIIWNVWVLLSIPAIWLTWSIILFIVSMMSFVWRTNPASDAVSTFILSSTGLLIIRIALSCVLGLGLIDAMLVANTFRLYGAVLDKDWRICIDIWRKAKAIEAPTMNLLTADNVPPGRFLSYLQPFLPFGPPILPAPAPPPIQVPPSMFPIAPPPGSAYSGGGVGLGEFGFRHPRQPRIFFSDSDSDTSSSSSSSVNVHPRRKARRRSKSPLRPPRPVGVPSRDPPARSSMRSPRIHRQAEPQLVSPMPRRPSGITPRANLAEVQNIQTVPDTSAEYNPSPPPESDFQDDYIQQENRVRFRSPLASAQESSDWGIYNGSFESSSNRVIGPSPSSATEITPGSSDIRIQNTEALRRRKPRMAHLRRSSIYIVEAKAEIS